jgi:hypothetical protein
MATTFSPRHIASAQLLERISPKVLFRLLKRYENFFLTQEAMPTSESRIDYDKVSLVFASPTEQMPPELMADIVYWDEVAQMGQIEDLTEIADQHHIELPNDVTIEEAALLLRLDAPDALEDIHATYRAQDLLRKKKRFVSYSATVDKLPKWKAPSKKLLSEFAAAMEGWYANRKKGVGVRISIIEKDDATWFIVRHGGTFKRENALYNGEPKVVFFRPAAFDLLIYYHAHGEMVTFPRESYQPLC